MQTIYDETKQRYGCLTIYYIFQQYLYCFISDLGLLSYIRDTALSLCL